MSGPTPPLDPEEISRKLQDFFKNAFGTDTAVPSQTAHSASQVGPLDTQAEEDFRFPFKPSEIKLRLDQYVIRQDEAKKVLAISVCDHYRRAALWRQAQEADPHGSIPREIHKPNILIAGPTGVGKTYLVKHIAELIGVPFVKADATKFSETGYVGGNVEDLVRDLVHKAGSDVSRAEHGIIYIDEIDKLAGVQSQGGRDISGRGVQSTLLKLMEDAEVPLRDPSDLMSQFQAMRRASSHHDGRETIQTRHILFIVSGAFPGLDHIIRRRTGGSSIGFSTADKDDPMDAELFREAITKDFTDFGFEAEFIGRLPVRVFCDPLSADDLFSIMKTSAGSLLRQYEAEFATYGITLHWDDEALREVALRASHEKTGARSLLTIWERILRDYKFTLPDLPGLRDLTIDLAAIKNPEARLATLREESARHTSDPFASDVDHFFSIFELEHGISLRPTPEFREELAVKVEREGLHVQSVLATLTRDFPFGLNLVRRRTGSQIFPLDKLAVTDPDAYLSGLVLHSYKEDTEV